MPTLLDVILYLHPDVSCTVWYCSIDDYMGDNAPIPLSGCLVDWNTSNAYPCPTQDIVNATDLTLVEQDRQTKEKQAREDTMKQDLSIVSGYNVAKMFNTNLTFTQYLDNLEQTQGTL